MARIERTKNASRKYLLWRSSKNISDISSIPDAYSHDLLDGHSVSGLEQSVHISSSGVEFS